MKYRMNIAGLDRDLPLCKVSDDLYIGAFVMFGDVELTVHCAAELLKLTPEYDYLIAPEAKAIPLVYEMARQSGADKYFVARKKAKAYMSSVFQVHVKSITTQGVQTLVLDQTDAELIHGKRIVIVDDVISTAPTSPCSASCRCSTPTARRKHNSERTEHAGAANAAPACRFSSRRNHHEPALCDQRGLHPHVPELHAQRAAARRREPLRGVHPALRPHGRRRGGHPRSAAGRGLALRVRRPRDVRRLSGVEALPAPDLLPHRGAPAAAGHARAHPLPRRGHDHHQSPHAAVCRAVRRCVFHGLHAHAQTARKAQRRVLLYNLSALRADLDMDRVRAFADEKQDVFLLPDQDILTALYGDRVHLLDSMVYNLSDRILALHNAELRNAPVDLDWVRAHTVIIHYCGRLKPWKPHYVGVLDVFYHELMEEIQK